MYSSSRAENDYKASSEHFEPASRWVQTLLLSLSPPPPWYFRSNSLPHMVRPTYYNTMENCLPPPGDWSGSGNLYSNERDPANRRPDALNIGFDTISHSSCYDGPLEDASTGLVSTDDPPSCLAQSEPVSIGELNHGDVFSPNYASQCQTMSLAEPKRSTWPLTNTNDRYHSDVSSRRRAQSQPFPLSFQSSPPSTSIPQPWLDEASAGDLVRSPEPDLQNLFVPRGDDAIPTAWFPPSFELVHFTRLPDSAPSMASPAIPPSNAINTSAQSSYWIPHHVSVICMSEVSCLMERDLVACIGNGDTVGVKHGHWTKCGR